MKKTPLILSIVAVAVAIAALALALFKSPAKKHTAATDLTETSAQAGDIVYLRIDTLIMQYDMYSDLRSAFEAKATSVQDDLQKKGRKLESDIKAFENQINKGLLTRSAAEQQQNALQQRQQDLQNLANQKQYELQEEEMVLNNQIMDAIKTFLEGYNEEHNFAAILTTSEATNVVIMGSPALDITQQVVEGLNAEYIKNRNN
ncbi:MAG: OmpH family outer membrane protein [Bacteroidales bacterium]|nr:OmpH family outer membrane protein [Candidatus Cacconaster merdequi]